MSVTESQRHQLYEALKAAHGEDNAETFMNMHTTIDISHLATSADLFVTKTDLERQLGAVKADVADLKTDVAGLKIDVAILKTDVAILKTDVADLKTDVAILRTDVAGLRVDVYQAITSQTRWMIGLVVSWSAVVVAAARLLF